MCLVGLQMERCFAEMAECREMGSGVFEQLLLGPSRPAAWRVPVVRYESDVNRLADRRLMRNGDLDPWSGRRDKLLLTLGAHHR